jgi:hypothetical protein
MPAGIGSYCKDKVLESFVPLNKLWTGRKYCEVEMTGTDEEQTYDEFLS